MIGWNQEPARIALLDKLADVFTPPERLTVSEWALKKRRLSAESNAKGGRFTFTRFPWQPEMLDTMNDPDISEVIVVGASQVTGKTESFINFTGYTIDIDPCAMMVIQPTIDMAETWSQDRLAPAIRDTHALRDKVSPVRSRDSGNKILRKRFPGGQLAIAGANSAPSLASRPVRRLFCDEVDRYPSSAGTEGDPVSLAEKRSKSYDDRFIYKTSTPTIKDESKIWSEFVETDQRHWHVPCPGCKAEIILRWELVKWAPGDPLDCWVECPRCFRKITDEERRAMVSAGRWIATAKGRPGVRGYHLSGIYSLFRPPRSYANALQEMVAEFRRANASGLFTLQVWWNTFLALCWELHGFADDDAKVLLEQREDYGCEVPLGVCILVAAVDCQGDRLECECFGAGIGQEIWSIERRTIQGAPELAEPWAKLDEWLLKPRMHASNREMVIERCLIDRGYRSKEVDHFTQSRNGRRVFSSYGSNRPGNPPLSLPARSGVRKVKGYRIGVDGLKEEIAWRIKNGKSKARQMHFPARPEYDKEYFDQLTGERLEKKWVKGKLIRKWVKIRPRNETLDLWVLGLAALEMQRINYDDVRKNLALDEIREQVVTIGHAKSYPLDQPPASSPEGQPEAIPNPAPKPDVAPAPAPKPVFRQKPQRSFVARWKY